MVWRPAIAVPGLPGRILSVAAAAILLTVAVTFSLLLFVVVAVGALLLWGYLWWKTRGLRRQMRERPPGGRVFEGEIVREPNPAATASRIATRPDN